MNGAVLAILLFVLCLMPLFTIASVNCLAQDTIIPVNAGTYFSVLWLSLVASGTVRSKGKD